MSIRYYFNENDDSTLTKLTITSVTIIFDEFELGNPCIPYDNITNKLNSKYTNDNNSIEGFNQYNKTSKTPNLFLFFVGFIIFYLIYYVYVKKIKQM